MSWHYLLEPGGESLEACCEGGEQLPPLRSKTIHAEFFCNGKLTESYLSFLSGMTSKPLTASRGADEQQSCPVASHVPTSAALDGVPALKESSQDFGERWPASLAKWHPDTSSWRTHQCLLFEDLTECLEIFPRWGSMRNGELWGRTMSTKLPISGTESGYLLPTPAASSYGTSNNGKRGDGSTFKTAGAPSLSTMASKNLWPTPMMSDYKAPNSLEGVTRKDGKSRMDKLPNVVRWPTPTSAEGSKIGSKANFGQVGLSNHPSIVGEPTREKMKKDRKGEPGNRWYTPQSRDYKGASGYRTDLPAQLETKRWHTPQCDDAKNLGHNKKRRETLTSQTSEVGQMLSPDWVEWLQGWPVGWTSLEPLKCDATLIGSPDWWAVDPADVGELSRTGVKIQNRCSRLKAIGNGQVPVVAAAAFEILLERLK